MNLASYNRRAEGHRAPDRGRSDRQTVSGAGEAREAERLAPENGRSYRGARDRLHQHGQAHVRSFDKLD